MIENGIFRKTYTVEVEINVKEAHYDAEWALESYECEGGLGEFIGQLNADLESELAELGE